MNAPGSVSAHFPLGSGATAPVDRHNALAVSRFPPAVSLTHKQRELLDYLRLYISKTGVAPTFDEMQRAVSLSTKSGVSRLLVALEERGHIQRLPNRARAIVLREPSTDLSAVSTEDLRAELARRAGANHHAEQHQT